MAAVVLVSTGGVAWTQTITGTILGTLTDPSGNVIVGAGVTLLNEGTGEQRSATTDVTGGFIFPSLRPGTYTVRLENRGFQSFEKKGNVLSANERLSLGSIQLSIGPVTQTVTVTAQGTTVETASAQGSALLTTSQLDTLAQRGRNIISMLQLLPGVSQLSQLETIHGNQRSSGSTSPNIDGIRGLLQTTTVDGLEGMDVGDSDSFTTSVSPDAVEEVKVLLNNYSADSGQHGGSIVEIITKSGTKDYHGTAYWYKRHEMFNATNFFNNRSGLPKDRYRYNTEGFSLGGPVTIPKVFNTSHQKLFFFFNVENDPGLEPQALQSFTVPTALERAGDFSQSLDQNGKLWVIKDPTTGAPFAGNVIPPGRINKSGQALINVISMPNQLNRSITNGAYNYQFQAGLNVEKFETLFRVDYHPADKDSIFFRGTTWESWRKGYGNLYYPPFKLFQTSMGYLNKHGVLGYTRTISPTAVNEFTAGFRRPRERLPLPPEAELEKVQRAYVGFTAGQFYPKNNPNGIIPQATFAGIPNAPTFSTYYGDRFPQSREQDVYLDMKDGLTINRHRHTFKAGVDIELIRVMTGWGFNMPWMGSFNFDRDPNNPLDTNNPYSNAILGNFQKYTEPTSVTQPAMVDFSFDWYVQDSWRVSNRLTLELGLRAAYGGPWYQWDGKAASLSLQRYDPSKAPVLYRPTLVGGQRLALNPLTGQTASPVLIGAFVPGTGDPANGMVLANDPTYPRGWTDSSGEMLEPRFGLAWDVFGNSKTAIRAGFGKLNHVNRYGAMLGSGLPPIVYNPIVFNGSLDTFLNAATVLSPSDTTSVEQHTKPTSIYHTTFGIQQNIGFGTVLDVKYVSTLGRNLIMSRNLNTLPYGARFLPQNQDPTTGKSLTDNFLRPYPGYANLTYYEGSGSSNYNALQVAANRRYTRGLQFGLAYTYSKTMDYSTTFPMYRPYRVWNYGKADFDQTHMLVLNFTYDAPALSKLWANPFTRQVLDHWQVSGVTTFASGTPLGITLTTTTGVDLTGGGDGQRVNVTGDPGLSHGERGLLQMFNTSVFALPGKGDPGNAPINVVRGPGINNFDLALFKNFPIKSEQHVLQLRWEFYNFFNHTQFGAANWFTSNSVDTTARFDPATGAQVNGRFGQAIAARPARVMQVSLRFRF